MVAHEKRNSAQLFCAVPTRNDLALSSLLFPAQPTQKLGYPAVLHVCMLCCIVLNRNGIINEIFIDNIWDEGINRLAIFLVLKMALP